MLLADHLSSHLQVRLFNVRRSFSFCFTRAIVPLCHAMLLFGFQLNFAEGEGLGSFGAAIELRSRLQQMDIELRNKGGKDGGGWEQIEGAYVRLPPGRAWGCVHFMGGAVLGGYPHIV
eukprot:6968436-Pyramimonas_sp.AAC.1